MQLFHALSHADHPPTTSPYPAADAVDPRGRQHDVTMACPLNVTAPQAQQGVQRRRVGLRQDQGAARAVGHGGCGGLRRQ
jgi:hypothetical protein